MKLLDKDKLSYKETELFYTEFNEGFIEDVTQHSAYFTPLEMAYDFALMSVPSSNVIVDMCAGIGVLTWCKHVRETYEEDKSVFVCIERNPKYIEIGKKLCPFAHWYEGDMFDLELWNRIEKEHGSIGCIMSNPPFGSVTKSDKDRSWLKYTGKDLDIAAIEIGLTKARHCAFILPQNSCTFQCSGKQFGYGTRENRKIMKLEKDLGYEIYMQWDSVDTTVYDQFKNTKVVVECCSVYKRDEY